MGSLIGIQIRALAGRYGNPIPFRFLAPIDWSKIPASGSLKVKNTVSVCFMRRDIITERGQSYVSRLPKYWPPTPLSARRVCTPPLFGGGEDTFAGRRGGGGGWKTRDKGLPSYSNNLYGFMDISRQIQLCLKNRRDLPQPTPFPVQLWLAGNPMPESTITPRFSLITQP